MGLLNRLFGRKKSSEEFAWELTDALADAFSGDPGIEILPPRSLEETLAYLKSIEIDEQEEDEDQ